MSQKEFHIFENTIDLMEGMWPTPLLRLNIGENVWGKLEFYNPFSRSIKDRTALFLFKQALREKTENIVEATSGNMGIAMAALSSIFNIKFTVFVPTTSPEVFKVMIKLLGSEVITAGTSTTEILPLVKKMSQLGSYKHLDQFHNEVNVIAHYETTAKELDLQANAAGIKIRRIIASMGTAGHIVGISKYFKEKYGDEVEIVGVEPSEGERIPGIKRVTEDNNFVKIAKIDSVIDVGFKDALEGVKEVARKSGILVGLSSGATVAAYKKLGDTKGATILIFPDDAFKYVEELKDGL
ncbi:cysteine synthase [Sulfolobus acidocaldarius]|uniref:Cysteine synthase B n=5 Tax=Sulfolobus acidocaldarius TaxID=2285 RepID=Q4J8T4_SULAC|nr:cysteine synthase B [Sulfolobus acidocaldarius DSM 639]AGE71395.1 cysteine synthase B [Sulfolobus acidocaldarius N8]AGE73666.1 cysteine synthase B [Sulfolobus acidocaldarius Ron12/I]ALU30360.1 cysteine synthase [Sulfolobus acidocaldarius]ALU31078.1 cysteine synthase [Sulfolobus acidocaldarius]